jgi:D-alanyl-lipoteichoic acid acyltransferase DltB (MBOAT superfamily)
MLRTLANVFVTMLLGGLWHGASWSFAVWGGMHGLYLIVYRIWAGSIGKHTENIKGTTGMVWRWVMIFVTFNAVSLAWAFFRITDVGDAFVCIKKVFMFNEAGLLQIINGDASIWSAMFFYAFISYLISCWLKTVSSDDNPPEICAGGFKGGFAIGIGVSLLFLSWLLSPEETAPFIYFQF